jgi:hypothetical protein
MIEGLGSLRVEFGLEPIETGMTSKGREERVRQQTHYEKLFG